ncbi:hypothetical protein [Jatrophihabitans fulvus]
MSSRTKTKRSVWAVIGRILWFFVSGVFKLLAALGSRWARKRLDRHEAEQNHPRRTRLLRRRR